MADHLKSLLEQLQRDRIASTGSSDNPPEVSSASIEQLIKYEHDSWKNLCEDLNDRACDSTDEATRRLTTILYDIVFAGEPAEDREVRWKWVELRIRGLVRLADASKRLCSAVSAILPDVAEPDRSTIREILNEVCQYHDD